MQSGVFSFLQTRPGWQTEQLGNPAASAGPLREVPESQRAPCLQQAERGGLFSFILRARAGPGARSGAQLLESACPPGSQVSRQAKPTGCFCSGHA